MIQAGLGLPSLAPNLFVGRTKQAADQILRPVWPAIKNVRCSRRSVTLDITCLCHQHWLMFGTGRVKFQLDWAR